MTIEIASHVVTAIVDHVRAAAPNEACGILFGEAGSCADAGIRVDAGSGRVAGQDTDNTAAPGPAWRILAAEPAANVAAHPRRAFEIDPAALLRAHRDARGQGRAVVGWYHSHPNGVTQPSATDAARAVEDGKLWLIAGVGEGVTGDDAAGVTLAGWRTVADGPVHGRFAPVVLVTD